MLSTHGIMFHHFHSNRKNTIHCKQQGSIDGEQLIKIISYLEEQNLHILNADEYMYKLRNNSLEDRDVTFTFDDNLLCQYEVAKPILDQFGIKAFWFINTLNLLGENIDYLEIFRHFRNYAYETIHDFYCDFFSKVEAVISGDQYLKLCTFDPDLYLLECPFYSAEDKKFKFCRDEILKNHSYEEIMFSLMENRNYDWKSLKNDLWMKEEQIRQLSDEGHVIGLHSHSHSTTIHNMSYEEQLNDYSQNKDYLEDICKKSIVSMSHPCGNYSNDTIQVLYKLGIEIGFLDHLYNGLPISKLLLPREDHANLIKRTY